ncbi:hypothetical protein KTS45_02555 [Halomicroarcula limicola]|uniref:Halobacterial output domain-containing protein n=1 Tax=Haloarcula limicola TaxID=1429915 RepID=A0A8J8C3H3_9EURY|nr:HalOD1 output domain-containing protein [Halomicroarcula limicola]MBV0923069.1 hypothetical protein [Halomicroarcula limicola]
MTKSPDDGLESEDDPTLGRENSWSQAAQYHFDPDADADLTTALVTAIADAKGVDRTELKSPILYNAVDAPAIQESFFGPDVNGESRRSTGTIEFEFDQYLVKVRSDGWIQVYE